VSELDARGFFEFTTRQMIITRVYAPKFWKIAALGHAFYCAAVTLGLFLWMQSAITGQFALHFLTLTFLLLGLAAIRGILRLIAILDLLPDWRDTLISYAWVWTLLAPVVPFAYFYNSITSAFTRRIRWRGVRYELLSPSETRLIP
jgi:ceramide glucosyltransferase